MSGPTTAARLDPLALREDFPILSTVLHDDQPLMFLWFTKEMFMVDGRFKNVQAGPLGLPSSVRFEWFAPRDKQRRGSK